MTLNGKIVAKGAPSRGDRTDSDIQNGRNRGTESYLLPWIWDSETGEKVAADKEKLYHWNTQGGTTTWDLPEGWTNPVSYTHLDVYKRQGSQFRVDASTLNVTVWYRMSTAGGM